MAYVGVVKALYDYDAQDPEGELSFKEDQILYVIEKEDDDWWKAKLKEEGGGTDGPIGLIPVTYVEPLPPLNHTRALYAYESTSPEELTVEEDAFLQVFSVEDEWLLVRARDAGPESPLGFVPRNYCDSLDDSGEVSVQADADENAAAVEAQRAAEAEEERKRSLAAKQRELKLKDKVEMWVLSEIDGKKKKKGTLGVGNGAIFFASDSDKSPVKQHPITDLTHVEQPSSKVLVLTIASHDEPLQFNTGSSKVSAAILAKLESSKEAAGEVLQLTEAAAVSSEDEEAQVPTTPATEPKSVRWAEAAPDSPEQVKTHAGGAGTGGEACVVLYDFEAGGDDELSVSEGEQLVVLEKENDEWWLVRNASGDEGVVPAQYVEISGAVTPGDGEDYEAAERQREEEEAAEAEAAAAAAAEAEAASRREQAHKAEERRAIERAAREKQAQEAADRELAERVEAEERAKRERRERRREEEVIRQREAEAARRREAARQMEPPKISKRPSAQDVEAAARNLPSTKGRGAPERPPDNNRPKPNPSRTRMWSDRSGQFKVEAEFLGMNGNKIRLHKLNGVIIEVPMEKMSNEDTQLIRRHIARRQSQQQQRNRTPPPDDEDDVPLGKGTPRRKSSAAQPSHETRARAESPIPAAAMEMPKPRKQHFDWFAFFLEAGCDMDDCTRYAANFERDRIDESILTELEPGTLRSLGLREGDVIRVKKAIQVKYGKKSPDQEAQIKQDEDYARQLQEHENSGAKGPTPAPPPGLFTGPDGKLANNTRRGRPERKGTATSASLDPTALAAASDQLSKVAISPISPRELSPPIAPSPPPERVAAHRPSTAPLLTGFDDDAWTIKPANKPASPAPRATPSPLSGGPAPSHTTASAPASAVVANGTESLLAQIQSLRPSSTGVSSQRTGGSFDALAQIPQQRPPNSQNFPPPSSYGLGVSNSSAPMSQLSVPQYQQQQVPSPNAPRGPLAPVPSNEGLLNPLQPNVTGMFVPTRMGSQSQPSPGAYLGPQATGFAQPQMQQQQSPMMMQPTGYGFQGYPQQPIHPSYTGYPGGYQQAQQQSAFNAIASIPPPQVPQQTGTNGGGGDTKFAPSNIFSAMKRADFATPEEQNPQPSNKYDALRPLTTGYNGAPQLYPQQTGMPMQMQQTGMPSGMPGMMPQMTGYNPQMGYMPQQNPYGYR